MSAMPEAQRFLRSINVEQDYSQPDALSGYVVSPVAHQTLLRILREFSKEQGTRSWSIVGPYGTGKSSFLVFLSWMLAGGNRAISAEKRLRNEWPHEADRCSLLLSGLNGGIEPILVTGHRGPLAPAMLAGLLHTAERLWPEDPLTHKINDAYQQSKDDPNNRDPRIHDFYLRVAQKVRESGKAGIIVLVDEFGKFLEYAVSKGGIGDIYLLQQLAELAARVTNTRIGLITVLHQDIEAYSADLPTAARNEWSKIKGRFEPITFMESANHLLMLVAGGVAASGARRQISMFGAPVEELPDITALKEAGLQQKQLLSACLPLNPVTALALGPLFRQGFGQNERSIFAFLLANEPNGFQEFLENKDKGQYRLDNLYDYLKVTATLQNRGSASRAWAMAETAFSRLPKNTETIDIKLIKTLCLLSFLDNLRADKATLALALGEPEAKVVSSINRLLGSVIVFRRYKSAYELWAGSDLDIDEVIGTALRGVRSEGGYAALLQQYHRPIPVIAARHYFQTGTLRHFSTRYVTTNQVFERSAVEGDGELRLVVPDNIDDLESLETRLLTESPTSTNSRPVVVALPTAAKELVEHIEDWRAIQRALKETPALDQDPVAKRELEEQGNQSSNQLIQALSRAFGSQRKKEGARWFYQKRILKLEGRPSLVASELFDDVYSKAPHIRNELVNRKELSAAAAAARKILIERLLSHASTPSLGIDGFPPEKSIYLSVLSDTGIHRLTAGAWGLHAPKGGTLSYLWSKLHHKLKDGTTQIGLASLLQFMADPPYGIREGLGLLLLIVWLIQNQDSIFFYEEGSFVPAFSSEVVHQMLKRPENFKIQASNPEGHGRAILLSLSSTLNLTNANQGHLPLVITRLLVRLVRGLSIYASNTHQISNAARKVRSAIKGARDPMLLLLEDLPDLLEVAEDPDAYSLALKAALSELQNADRALLGRLEHTLYELFHTSSLQFYQEISDRAKRLRSVTDLSSSLRRFVEITLPLEPADPESRRLWLVSLAIALIGKPPENWSDAEEPRFAVAAMELYRTLTATEQLALERKSHGEGVFHLIRVSVLDSDGQDQTGVTVLRQEDSARIDSFKKKVIDLARSNGIQDKELAYAVIASMMEFFPKEPSHG